MLVHNAHAVYCLKYFTAKLTLVPIFLHYFYLYCAHDCNIDAHAKNIPTLFMNDFVLLTQQLTLKFLLHPPLGGPSGVSVCTLVLYVH